MIDIDNVFNIFNQFLTTYGLYPHPIPQYPNYYVDPFGNVFDRFGNQITPYHYPNQYDSFMVRDNSGKPRILGVHQAVAMTYSPDWFDGCVVHHIDENKFNNCINNLKCESRSDHSRHHGQKYFDTIKQCQVCGKWFVWTTTQQHLYYTDIKRGRARFLTCSKSCAGRLARFTQLGFDANAIINPFGV